jgi:hypothetical protein
VTLSFTTLLRLKCCHACDQCHSSRVATFLPVRTDDVIHHCRDQYLEMYNEHVDGFSGRSFKKARTREMNAGA